MEQRNQRLTLDHPETYQIRVPGVLDEGWVDWDDITTITVEYYGDGMPVTILTGSFDQAALQGLLRRLYCLGLPLISVQCVGVSQKDVNSNSDGYH